ncbi:MAG TPA: ABC transporter permease [Gemmatimonadaceae bacterium]
MDTFVQDIRYAARKLLRSPGFSFVAVATLSIAIGATTAVFSIVDGVLLKALPYRAPQELVRIGSTHGKNVKPMPISGPDYIDYRDKSRSFVGFAQYRTSDLNLTSDGSQPMRLSTGFVGARFFALLGVTPEQGRWFAADDDQPSASNVVVLSDKLWRSRFAADPRIIGQSIHLDGNAYAVIGIAPASVTYPSHPDIWVPLRLNEQFTDPNYRGSHSFGALARLKPGVPLSAAQAEISNIAANIARTYPDADAGFGAVLQPLQEQIVGNVRPALFAMLGAVVFVLLIACANVANLLLVRASARETEIAVRAALGAGRGRIIRQLVTENVLLSVVATVVGSALAAWIVDAVVAYGPPSIPRLDEIGVDARVLIFSAALAILTGVLFGLVPAIHAARSSIGETLKDGTRGSSSRRGAQRVRSVLVVSETALALVLLAGAGLLVRSFVKLVHVDPGFRTDHVMTFDVALPQTKYVTEPSQRHFAEMVSQRLSQLPATQAVGVTFAKPLNRMMMRTTFDVRGKPPARPGEQPVVEVRPTSLSCFLALKIRLIEGRLFDPSEERVGPPPALVVTQEFARRYFPNESPIGKHISLGMSHDTTGVGKSDVPVEGDIVGVVADIKQQGLDNEAFPAVYVPFGVLPMNNMSFLVRSSAEPGALARAIRARVAEVDRDLPIFGLQSLDDVMSDSVSQPRFYMMLLGAFSLVALLLAALGIYGVISYSVAQRTRELGIRLALGARQRAIVQLVLGQGLALTVTGVIIGLAAAFWLTRVISGLLFGVAAADPLTFGGVAAGLLGIAALASYLPARRAALVDPVVAMRTE